MENMVNKFKEFWPGKKVLVTGHTGFKGAWMSLWLHQLGANVYGYSDEYVENSMYKTCKLSELFTGETFADIADYQSFNEVMNGFKPDIVFHLAAQAIVSESYENPFDTIKTNTLGFASVLESARKLNHKCTLVLISTDKCYFNNEWYWGYKETDVLGGKDPYSGSKAAAEIIFNSYFESFFKKQDLVRISSVRAGNVIGGGDWSKNRLVPDIFRAYNANEEMTIRMPGAVRPWQFVLEPLLGYLITALKLDEDEKLNGESFNFGPFAANAVSVKDLIAKINKNLPNPVKVNLGKSTFKEATYLKLLIDKANHVLGWYPQLNIDETIAFTSDWYLKDRTEKDMRGFSEFQIKKYQSKAFGDSE